MKRRISLCITLAALLVYRCSPPHVRTGRSPLGDSDRSSIIRTARDYLGVPYRYGGTTPGGFDCSGFVMYVFRKNGYAMPRGTTAQFREGRRIGLREARPGDLVFFNTGGRKRISHVGIYAGRGRFIHAPSTGKKVSYAEMDNRYWRKRFVGAVSHFSGARNGGYYGSNRGDSIYFHQ